MDYWFVSHGDKDHVSGLEELLEQGYSIKNLVISREAVIDDEMKQLLELAKKAGTKVLEMGYQDCLHLGEASISCVFPYPDFASEDKNAASLVLYYEEGGLEGLFTGDIGVEEEAWIADRIAEWRKTDMPFDRIEVYKVAHHGSKYSNGETLLSVIEPEVAVVSCSEKNTYGHPHKETIKRLGNAGCSIWSTAKCGQVTIEKKADMVVKTKLLWEESGEKY